MVEQLAILSLIFTALIRIIFIKLIDKALIFVNGM